MAIEGSLSRTTLRRPDPDEKSRLAGPAHRDIVSLRARKPAARFFAAPEHGKNKIKHLRRNQHRQLPDGETEPRLGWPLTKK